MTNSTSTLALVATEAPAAADLNDKVAVPTVEEALAATDPFLDKLNNSLAGIVMITVDVGRAFGTIIAKRHPEPLDWTAFLNMYAAPLAAHVKARTGYTSGNGLQVATRVAHLVSAGCKVPTRAAVLKKSGTEKPLSDTMYLPVLAEAQKKAGLAVAKPGCGGDRKSEAAQVAKVETGKANPASPEAQASPVVQATVAKVEAAKAGTPAAPVVPPVAPTIDTAKAKEDAAACLMGNAKHADLLLKAIQTRKAALIAWLQTPPAK